MAYISSIGIYQYGSSSDPHGSFTIKDDDTKSQTTVELTADEAAEVHRLIWTLFGRRQSTIANNVKEMAPLMLQHKTIDADHVDDDIPY